MSEWRPIDTAPKIVQLAGAAMKGELGRLRMKVFTDTGSGAVPVSYVLWLGPLHGSPATHWWTGRIDGFPK